MVRLHVTNTDHSMYISQPYQACLGFLSYCQQFLLSHFVHCQTSVAYSPLHLAKQTPTNTKGPLRDLSIGPLRGT